MADITLVMIVRNRADRVKRAIESASNLVKSITILDQGSDDADRAYFEEVADLYVRTTWKAFNEADRAYCFSLPSCDWILNLDSDEYLDEILQERIPHLVESGPEVFWFHFTYLVDGVDVSPEFGDNLSPRLWKRRTETGQVTIKWPSVPGAFPKINTLKQCIVERGRIVHEQTFEDILRSYETQMQKGDPSALQFGRRFLERLRRYLS